MNTDMSFIIVDLVTFFFFNPLPPLLDVALPSEIPFEVNNTHTRYILTFKAEKVNVKAMLNVHVLMLQLDSVFGPIQSRFERERRIAPLMNNLQNNGWDSWINWNDGWEGWAAWKWRKEVC